VNLALSIIALALGPLLYSACRRVDFARSALDGLLFVSIAGLVVVHIAPDVYEAAGYMAIGVLLAGVVIAFTVERLPEVGGRDRYTWIVVLGALGLIVHAAIDGVALLPGDHLHGTDHLHGAGADAPAPDDHDHDVAREHEGGLADLLSSHLALGVVLHRIPVGMAIWSTVRPRLGTFAALSALLIIVVATSAAYLLGEPVIEMMEGKSVACFQAFVAGTLLHVIAFSTMHKGGASATEPQEVVVIAERLGVIAAIFLLFLVPHAH